MPKVKGEGPYKQLESVQLPGDLVGKQRVAVDGFVVPWGYYYYGHWDHNTRQLATASLGSCFAAICHHLESNKIFFAHVSNDGETDSIVSAIQRINPARDGYTCVIVMGMDPNNLSTLLRINKILTAAQYGFHIFQAEHGACSYSIGGDVELGSTTSQVCTVDKRLVTQAMFAKPHLPLRQMQGSLDLTSQ
ncbi:MAG: hypothetical protein U0359_38550 [Byssovorax sp.]